MFSGFEEFFQVIQRDAQFLKQGKLLRHLGLTFSAGEGGNGFSLLSSFGAFNRGRR